LNITSAISERRRLEEWDLSVDERAQVKSKISSEQWGSSTAKKQFVRVLLTRLNDAKMAQESQTRVDGIEVTLQIEHILPENPNKSSRWCSEWTEEERASWTHRLGNLCLLNEKTNKSLKNHNFSDKRPSYKGKPFPFTQQISDFDNWTVDEVKRQHEHLLQAVERIFEL
jgi:hypothetical protein